MTKRRWEVGICGTFDVENYGDLLFPLIAESELKDRLGDVILHRFSYNAKTPLEWPYEVTSIAALPEVIHRLDGLLVGGGFLIRFDQRVADGYVPPNAGIHHPTGYWLTPALIALQHNVPLVWNAPGMHCNEIPEWARPLVELALTNSRSMYVRDDLSRLALEPFTGAPVNVLPDTGFGLPRVANFQKPPSAEFVRLSKDCGLHGPYIVLQASVALGGFVDFLKRNSERFENYRFLVLPISVVFGESTDNLDLSLPGAVRLTEWPHPLVIAELIGRSEAVVGFSYHLFITALAAGVPVFTPYDIRVGKYSELERFEGINGLPGAGDAGAEWFVNRIGRRSPSVRARDASERLGSYWDAVAATLRAGPAATAPALNRFWQTLPSLLEDCAAREHEAAAREHEAAAREREAAAREHEAKEALAAERSVAADIEGRMEEALRLVTSLRDSGVDVDQRLSAALEELKTVRQDCSILRARLDEGSQARAEVGARLAQRETRIAEMIASKSWRLTAPLRLVGRRLLKLGERS